MTSGYHKIYIMNNLKINENPKSLMLIAQKEILSFKEALIYLDVSDSFLYKLTSKKSN